MNATDAPWADLAPEWSQRAATAFAATQSADGRLDADAFVALLDPEVEFRIGASPALRGRAAVREAVGHLFGAMSEGLVHAPQRAWSAGDTLVYEAEVTYRLRNGVTLSIPYVNVLDFGADDLIRRYLIFVDLAPLGAAMAKA